MKPGKIGEYVVIGAILGSFALGALYSVVGFAYTQVTNSQNNFRGVVEIESKRVTYSGRKPHNFGMRFFGQDPNGHAQTEIDNGSLVVKDNDLTKPGLSLEDRITITFPGGQKIEFDHSGIYNDDKHHPFESGSEIEKFFQNWFLEAQEAYKEVEPNIQEAIAKR